MRREDVFKRVENNEKARELIDKYNKEGLREEEIATLKALHTGYGGISDNTQYFTPIEVVDYMMDALKTFEFSGKRVLEPSSGNGIFVENLLKNFSDLDITSIELNYELYNLNKICYKEVNNINANTLEYFDLDKLEDIEKFDLVIGNPPFGRGLKDNRLPLSKSRLEAQFLELSLKLLNPGGHLLMVVPTSVLANSSYRELRSYILKDFCLIQSIELPCSTFIKSDTSVSTSILHLRKIKTKSEFNYKVLMAVADSVGWDEKGNKTNNDLIKISKGLKNFYIKSIEQFSYFF